MPTLGEELKRLREARGISLAEIAEATRIGTRFLKAIETDHFSILPGGIFTRSFIRAYAKQVGMDEQEAVRRYQQQVGGPGAEAEQIVEAVPSEPNPRKEPAPIYPQPIATKPATRGAEPVTLLRTAPRTSWGRVIIAAAIVLFIGVVVVTLVRQLNSPSDDSESLPPTLAKAGEPQPDAAPQNDSKGVYRAGGAVPAAAVKTAQSSAQSERPPSDGKLLVKLEASTGDSWIKYQVDDESPTQMILKQGQVQEIPAALNQIRLNYGNREILKLTINNRKASFPPDAPKFAAQVVISRENLDSFFQ